MNNIRHDHTSGYINDDELNRQIGELADTTRVEHYEKVIAEQKQQYQHLSDSYDEGKMTKEEVEQMKLMHKINASFPSENHEARWARQNEAALEAKRVTEKMEDLAKKYSEKRIDDATYYERWAKLKARRDAAESQI